MKKRHIIVVAGPTASGKSDFAVDLALEYNGEIISADSRQIYRYLDIGTGKISKKEMKGVPHHMIDVCDINDSFSVAEYKKMALPIIEDILTRGKTPIICGGTGQYIDALIFTSSFPRVPPNKKLREELEKKTTEALFNDLKKKDSRRAKVIDKYNRVRIIRALEIIHAIGKVPSLKKESLQFDVTMYLLDPKKEILEKRIEKRLLKRLENGMLTEMSSLLQKGYTQKKIAERGIEYRYMSDYMDKKISYDELVQKLKTQIWRYAKRQKTWNKKYLKKYPSIITLVTVE